MYKYKMPLKKFYCKKCKKIFHNGSCYRLNKKNIAYAEHLLCGKICREFILIKKCEFCLKTFNPKKKNTRFCSERCMRQVYNRKRRKRK
jgi:hypothetical protein